MAESGSLVSFLFVVVSGLLFCGFGLYILSDGWPSLRRGLRLRGSEQASVQAASTASGPLALHGVARMHSETVLTPFAQADCFASDSLVQEPKKRGRWSTKASVPRRVPFRVEDQTGSILVDPTDATTLFANEWEETYGVGQKPPEHMVDALEELGVTSSASSGTSFGPVSVESAGHGADAKMTIRRFRDEWLAPGDDVFVYGSVRQDPPGARPDEPGDVKAVVRGDDENPLVISNRPASETARRFIVSGLKDSAKGLVVLLVGLGIFGFLALDGLRMLGALVVGAL